MLVTTKRGLSLGFLPSRPHHLRFIMMRRFHGQLLRVRLSDIQRRHARSARRTPNHDGRNFMADSALRFNTVLPAKLHEVFHLRLAVQKIQNLRRRKTTIQAHPDLGLRKKLRLSRSIKRRSRPTAPAEPGAPFPGRNTAVTRYCSASWLKVRKPTIGR